MASEERQKIDQKAAQDTDSHKTHDRNFDFDAPY